MKPLMLEDIELLIRHYSQDGEDPTMISVETLLNILETARLAIIVVEKANLLEMQTRLPENPIYDMALINMLREALAPFRQTGEG